MNFLLVIFTIGLKTQALTTESFADLKSCNNAGKAITEWVDNNDDSWGRKAKFTCIKVTGK